MFKNHLLNTTAVFAPPIEAAAESAARRRSGAYSVAEFCREFSISSSMLFKMWAKGEGPDRFKVGTRTLISEQAAAKWRRAQERAAKKKTA
jgi:hypothetical protein